ncbi:hypothetical protein CTEN210_16012 [Chaetoceros tenuissimus]|uniref:Leucine-rich repeat domain-containing protein n=1 Tax=Chaetoceros tenuissimus TaxID=426638 RepID=A0AAD3HDS4_9STRA|nr:hypothetical protein CTEN210_16012 [Chaetoceros tenuissimus]
MRVQTEEWRHFVPEVRIYKGKKTLFWNGEKLWDGENKKWLVYNHEERQSWEAIIILPGVEIIPERTFIACDNFEMVIMADTVKRIEKEAFLHCTRLVFVRLSRNLEFIGEWTFCYCDSLTSIFIPPTCREIGDMAFFDCKKLIILHVPQDTRLGFNVIAATALIEASPFETKLGIYSNGEEVNDWIKNQNMTPDCELHRACSSFNPIQEHIYGIAKRKGFNSFHAQNAIGITPLQYLEANPFVEICQKKEKDHNHYAVYFGTETV